MANGPKRRLRGGELAEHPGGELPEHFGSAWWNYLSADIQSGVVFRRLLLVLLLDCRGSGTGLRSNNWPMDVGVNRVESRLHQAELSSRVTRRDGAGGSAAVSAVVRTPSERLWNACWGNWRRWSRSYQDRSIQGSLTAAS